jgi:hypothetical protein
MRAARGRQTAWDPRSCLQVAVQARAVSASPVHGAARQARTVVELVAVAARKRVVVKTQERRPTAGCCTSTHRCRPLYSINRPQCVYLLESEAQLKAHDARHCEGALLLQPSALGDQAEAAAARGHGVQP